VLAWTRATGEDGCSVTGRSSPADALLPLPSLVICALKNLHPASRALQNPLPYRTLRVRDSGCASCTRMWADAEGSGVSRVGQAKHATLRSSQDKER